MADIKLVKPQAGERVTIQSAPDARLEFAFSTTDAVLEKSGNDLVFTFDDGSSVVLSEFYTAYTKETLPDFVVEGQTIVGADFFAALGNDDLMPAAGPAAARPAPGARFREYEEAGLLSGIDRLDGLDLPWQQQTFQSEDLASAFIPNVDGGEILNAAPVLDITAPEVLSVMESGVKQGGNEQEDGISTVTGKVNATDPEGDALIFFVDADGNRVNSITTEYGTITIDNDGNYIYTLNNDGAANGLAFGESFSENFTVGVQDSNGNVATQTVDVVIDVVGTNDRPTLEVSDKTLTVTEDGDVSGSVDGGKATGDDVDNNAELTYSFVDKDGNPLGNTTGDADGTFTIDPTTGEYTYTLTDGSTNVQGLGEGESMDKTFIVRVQDEHGAWSNQEVTVTITGTNDVPTVDVASAAVSVIEAGVQNGNDEYAGEPSVDGKLAGKDADTNDDLTYTLKDTPIDADGKQTIDTPYGQLVLNTVTGEYTYTMNQDASNTLNVGESNTDKITVTISDGKGGTIEQDITVTINGTNDKPTLEVTEKTLTVTEDGGVSGSVDGGKATGDDVDNNAELTYGFVDKDGKPLGTEVKDADGTFTIDPTTGEYTYTLTNGSAAVQALGDGESITKTFTVQVQDEHGAWSNQEVTVVINGTNDVPTVDVDGSNLNVSVIEAGVQNGNDEYDGQSFVKGTIAGKDVDTNDDLTYTLNDSPIDADGKQTIDTPYGQLVLNTVTGEYIYTMNQDASNTLNVGESNTDKITVTISDGKGGTIEQDITVTINGTNDKPTLEVTEETLTVTEDGGASGTVAGGDALGKDVDHNAELTYGFVDKDGKPLGTEVKDADGTFTIDPTTGEYTYTLTNGSAAVQALGDGESIIKTFTVRVQDEHGAWSNQVVTVVINGTNDVPVVDVKPEDTAVTVIEAGVKDGGNDTEIGVPSASGSVHASDVDTNDTLTYKAGDGPIDADGKQTFDTPYGHLELNTTNGNYEYFLDNNASNNLSLGDTRTETITVTIDDGKGGTITQNITVTITGTNDAPELTVDGGKPIEHQLVEDSGTTTINGSFGTVDVDADGTTQHYTVTGDANTVITKGEAGLDKAGTDGDKSAVYETAYGTLTLNMDGTYTYVLNNEGKAAQALHNGEIHTEKFTVTVTDEHGAKSQKDISIDIKGTNDLPVLTPVKDVTHELKESGVKQGGNDTEEGTATASGQITASDVDTGDTLSYVVTGADGKGITGTLQSDGKMAFNTEYGILLISPDGSYTYQILNGNGDVNSLPFGERLEEHFSVQVKDQHGAVSKDAQDINVVIEGTNDRPTFTIAGKEADNKFSLDLGKGKIYGWSDAKIDDVDDNHSNTITITGKNGLTGEAVEGHNEASTGKDTPASFTTDYGTLTINPATGKIGYQLDPDSEFVKALAAGEKHQEKFTIRVQDEHGAWVEREITINITGKNDAPDVEVSRLDIQEDRGTEGVVMQGTLGKEGAVKATDVDNSHDTLHYNLVDDNGTAVKTDDTLRQTLKGEGGVDQNGNIVSGDYGYLTLDPATGTYEYKLFNDSDLVQKMGEGEWITQTFRVKVSDGKGGETYQDIKVTIHGTNDKPTLSGNHAGVVEDGGALARPDLPGEETANPTTSGKLEIHDIDVNDEKSFVLKGEGVTTAENGDMTIAGKYGTLTLHPDGSYTYELTYKGEDLQEMDPGKLFAQENFEVTWKSGKDEATTTITIDINGANDRPDQGDQQENTDKAPCTDSGLVPGFDIDNDDSIDDKSLSFSIMNQYDKDGNPVQGGGAFEDTTGKEDAPGADDNHWQPEQTGNGLYGSLTINPDGTYVYTLNVLDKEALDAYFKANPDADSIKETFTVTVTDEHGASHSQEITVSVPKGEIPGMGGGEGGKPDPDTSVESVTTEPLDVQEDGSLNQTGKVTVEFDCKHGPNHPGQGEGHDNSHGDAKYFFFAFKDDDGNYVQTISDQYGSITINPITGEYTYTLNNDSKYVQELNEGEKLNITLPPVYVITDENGKWAEAGSGKIDVSITGTNDAPIIDNVDNLNVAEDATGAAATVDGKVSAHDVDAGGLQGDDLTYSYKDAEGNTIAGDVETAYGKLTVNADGSYSFTVDPSKTQGLGVGDTGHIKFTVEVSDGHGGSTTKEIDVTVTGSNDAPTWTVNGQGQDLAFTEDGGVGVLKGQVGAEDVDKGDNADLRYSMTNEGGQHSSYILPSPYGTMILNPMTGEYEFRLDGESKQVQELGAGEIREVKYTITVSDGNGGTAEQDVVVTIKGTDDAAEITMGTTVGNVTEAAEGKPASVDFGQIKITDKDANDTQTLTIKNASGDIDTVTYKSGEEAAQVAGKYGTLTMNADGTYSYQLTSDALSQGDKFTETFTIMVNEYAADGTLLKSTPTEVKVNLSGSNDKPVIEEYQESVNISEIAGSTASVSGKFVATDVDAKDDLTYTIVQGTYGKATYNEETGEYTYTLLANLPAHPPFTDKFTINVSDGKGGLVGKEITVNITGTNTDPVLDAGGSDLQAVIVPTDDGIHFTANGHLEVTDVDKDTPLSYKADANNGHHGTLTFDNDGNYTYKLNDNYRPTAEGEKDSFTVTVDDGHGGSTTTTVTVDLGNTETLHNLMDSMSNAQLDALAASKESNNLNGSGTASDGDDMLFGGAGENTLFGKDGDDVLFGLGGDDNLYGGEGNDILLGGSGNDYLNGGAGEDKLFGGEGNDIMAFDSNDLFDGGAGTDILVGDANSMDAMLAGLENGDITNVEMLVAGNGLTNLTDMAAMSAELGFSLNANGSVDASSLTGAGFAAGEIHTIDGQNFVEYTHSGDSPDDKMTLLVAQTLVQNGNI